MFVVLESWQETYSGVAVGILAMGHVASPKPKTAPAKTNMLLQQHVGE
jgi:hypothetical protein